MRPCLQYREDQYNCVYGRRRHAVRTLVVRRTALVRLALDACGVERVSIPSLDCLTTPWVKWQLTEVHDLYDASAKQAKSASPSPPLRSTKRVEPPQSSERTWFLQIAQLSTTMSCVRASGSARGELGGVRGGAPARRVVRGERERTHAHSATAFHCVRSKRVSARVCRSARARTAATRLLDLEPLRGVLGLHLDVCARRGWVSSVLESARCQRATHQPS